MFWLRNKKINFLIHTLDLSPAFLFPSVQNSRMFTIMLFGIISQHKVTGPRSAVGNVSGYRCVSDCRSRGREFDPGPVPYFRGD